VPLKLGEISGSQNSEIAWKFLKLVEQKSLKMNEFQKVRVIAGKICKGLRKSLIIQLTSTTRRFLKPIIRESLVNASPFWRLN